MRLRDAVPKLGHGRIQVQHGNSRREHVVGHVGRRAERRIGHGREDQRPNDLVVRPQRGRSSRGPVVGRLAVGHGDRSRADDGSRGPGDGDRSGVWRHQRTGRPVAHGRRQRLQRTALDEVGDGPREGVA
uniref:Uncharacterized protein n=1 Tax=uncultured marine virus TaxID=186617 RepID=A0A0F7L3J6_9VIRU|nr:hypothetical protein [uncultured marine virus]